MIGQPSATDRLLGRRSVLAFSGIAATWPMLVHAEKLERPVRIGFVPLGSAANAYDSSLVEAFRRGLARIGLQEGRDIVLDVAWVANGPDNAVAEVLQRRPGLLVTAGTSASLAAKRQTWTIPIVFISVGNPVGIGIAESVSRPGHNATGFSDILASLGGKLVEFAHEVDASSRAVDYLWHTNWADGEARYHNTMQAAEAAGLQFRSQGVRDADGIPDAIAKLKAGGAANLIVQPSPFTYRERVRLIDATGREGLGTVFAFPVAAREGALIAYGPEYLQMHERAAFYVDRILKGAAPADLPIDEAAKLHLVVNLKTAKAVGHEVPLRLLVGADELIE